MTSLFPNPERAPQQEFNRDEIPDEVRLDFRQLLDWFTPNIFVCWIILAIDILVFLMMVFSGFNPDHALPQALLKWGADYGPATIGHGQWWRVITATFVHLGWAHIVFNMIVLAQIGPFMERLLGNVGFLIVYLAAGIAGSICSLAWNPYIFSAGASGAIFGLYSALIGFLILRKDSIPGPVLGSILKSAVLFLVYNAVFGFINSGTDVAAHAGGLASGLICGLAISNPINAGFRQRRLVRATAAGFICVAVLAGVGARLPRPMDFQAELTKFGSSESKILSNYKTLLQHAGTMKDAELADQIQAQVVIPWSAEHQSLQKLTGLPKPQQHLVGMLLDYMDERQHGFANMVHGLRTHNVELVKQSLKQQMDAQTKLQAAIRVPQ